MKKHLATGKERAARLGRQTNSLICFGKNPQTSKRFASRTTKKEQLCAFQAAVNGYRNRNRRASKVNVERIRDAMALRTRTS